MMWPDRCRRIVWQGGAGDRDLREEIGFELRPQLVELDVFRKTAKRESGIVH